MAVPFVAGAVHDTVALPFPRVALGLAGADGTASGVTAADAADAGDVPTPLVAVTVNLYAVPLVSPWTVQLSVESKAGEQVFVPGDEVTVYELMAVPFVAGAVQVTVALWFPRVALGWAGADGTPAGMTAVEAGDASDVPIPLVAVTVKVYAVPLVSPPTVQLKVDKVAGEQVFVPGDDVTVYELMAVPFVAGAVQVTVALLFPRVATGRAGAEGNPAGVTGVEAADAGDVPTPLVAVTVNV